MSLGDVFADPEVARAYRQRPPYPDETFAILEKLLVEPRAVLDVGTGNGALARRIVRFAERVDAVDPSVAMIDEGRRLPGGSDPRLRWIVGPAETAPLEPPYGLITAGSSLHWMDHDRVLPRFAAALAPAGRLAIVETDEGSHPIPELLPILDGYSGSAHHGDLQATVAAVSTCRHAVDARLEATGRFIREGEERTRPVSLRRSVDDYIEFLHSTSELARIRLGARADQFDLEVREVFARSGLSWIERQVVGIVVWGRVVAA